MPLDRAAIRVRIRESGLRATAGRVATYAALARARRPLAHADVVSALKEAGLDRTTIYRNLTDLTEAGLLIRRDLGHSWRFELKQEHARDHAHFVCTDCGAVACLSPVAIRVKGRAPRAVADKAYDLQLRGICDDCS